MKLGYGIVAYRNLMRAMIIMLGILCLLNVPALWIYRTGGGYFYKSKIAQGREVWSLGNLGYSDMECSQVPIGIGKLQMSCPYGTIGSIVDFGVNNVNDDVSPTYCSTTKANAACTPTNPDVRVFLEDSVGQTSVAIEFVADNLWLTPNPSCANQLNNVYIQYSCVMNEEQQYAKFVSLCIVVLFGGLTCMLFLLFLRWLHYKGVINQAEWDCSTITVSDYSVELPIRKKSYKKWYQETYLNSEDAANNVAPVMSLKKYMIEKLEDYLAVVSEKKEEEGEDDERLTAMKKKMARLSSFSRESMQ